MINYSSSSLERIIVHKIGNKTVDEKCVFSKKLTKTSKDLNEKLISLFLSAFKNLEENTFFHEIDLSHNSCYRLCSEIFSNELIFKEKSVDLGKLLYEATTHPKIKSGEFYVVHFKNIFYNDTTVDALGLFKTEDKETYVKVDFEENVYQMMLEAGINFSSIEKGAIILNFELEEGLRIFCYDKNNKSNEALYWKNDFLKIKPLSESYSNTELNISICKDFITKVLPEEFEVDKTNQIDLLQKSADYYKHNDRFEIEDFIDKVFSQKDVADSFLNYRNSNIDAQNIGIVNEFEISQNAAIRQIRKFKKSIILDENFEIYIYSNLSDIEKGYDKTKAKNYYKLFFDIEK
jgi:37-kD nucleoid-associated bacterial protein